MIHLIKIRFPIAFDICCQFELRSYERRSLHYYKAYWLGLFFFSLPYLLISQRKVLDRKKKKTDVSTVFMHQSLVASLHARFELGEARAPCRCPPTQGHSRRPCVSNWWKDSLPGPSERGLSFRSASASLSCPRARTVQRVGALKLNAGTPYRWACLPPRSQNTLWWHKPTNPGGCNSPHPWSCVLYELFRAHSSPSSLSHLILPTAL